MSAARRKASRPQQRLSDRRFGLGRRLALVRLGLRGRDAVTLASRRKLNRLHRPAPNELAERAVDTFFSMPVACAISAAARPARSPTTVRMASRLAPRGLR